MGYKIEGDGSYQHTKMWKDGVEIPYKRCRIIIDQRRSIAWIDDVPEDLDWVLIKGVYMVIGGGGFANTKIFHMDEVLRGVQGIDIRISEKGHPKINIDSILLPNIVEDVPEPRVDPDLITYAEEN